MALLSTLPRSSLGPDYYPRLLVLFLAAFFTVLATAFGCRALVKEKQDEGTLKKSLIPGIQIETTDIFITTLITTSILLLMSGFTIACLGISLHPRTKNLSTHAVRVQVVFSTLGALCLLGTMVPYLIVFRTHHVGVIILSPTNTNQIPESVGPSSQLPMDGQIVGLPSTSIFTNAFTSNISTLAFDAPNSPSNFLKEYNEIAYLLQFAFLPWLSFIANLVAAGVLFYQTWDSDVDESELRGLGFEFGSTKDPVGASKSTTSQVPLMVQRAIGGRKSNVRKARLLV
ncbi:hypothetical protein CPB83DRAFT_332565 [Crepidotus variabilis]|uniref:Uncharacterized protein n=1 Tax=Crepidotus variabilis TaxID=179855 RepID=A0A9P6ESK0_9AGAR|nr:hypothetical protein CPB83DRAFT_332565 [Crepidotus variabilis]